ncbi:Oxo-4-hydroxy-4-carboxy-5-ureidoimidazoline decarboxylase [Apiosordaria backusii]|uniref:Oxo-4-hydroxy-4-carboxy-5-ureidoimidazoline decarboxylase n=1 Tax=Apiosordaria backusii TaxID=314023 RepID=A0AA40BLH8_9PEZI|nr:Oxo-4-hydroxy-4-carboxy-5-ureidoimidazoline decarboxylase [Apiosordaria backusii]
MSALNPTATPFLPAISSLSTLPDTAITSTLDLLFEPTSELHSLALPTIRTCSFGSYDELIDTLRGQLLTIASEVQDNSEGKKKLYQVLGSHPRLGAPKPGKQGEELSEQSKNEQKQLRGGDEREARRLAELNEEYEETFPGLRYVIFVNGRGRDVIMEDMERRIKRGDIREEEKEGIQAMCDIAKDRAGKLLKSAEEAV